MQARFICDDGADMHHGTLRPQYLTPPAFFKARISEIKLYLHWWESRDLACVHGLIPKLIILDIYIGWYRSGALMALCR